MRCKNCKKKKVTIECKWCKEEYCTSCIQVEEHNCSNIEECVKYKKDKLEDTFNFLGELHRKKKVFKTNDKSNPFNKLLSLNIK